jgi:hypothetical protein
MTSPAGRNGHPRWPVPPGASREQMARLLRWDASLALASVLPSRAAGAGREHPSPVGRWGGSRRVRTRGEPCPARARGVREQPSAWFRWRRYPVRRVPQDRAFGRRSKSTSWTLTEAAARSRLDGLPRRAAERWLVGVRPFFENSTACQKSMPSFTSVCGVAWLVCGCVPVGWFGWSRGWFLWLRWMDSLWFIRDAGSGPCCVWGCFR